MTARVMARLLGIEIKTYLREPVAIIWTFAFPIVLLVVLMEVYGGDEPTTYMRAGLVIDDRDRSSASAELAQAVRGAMAGAPGLAVEPLAELADGADPAASQAVLAIPAGFGDALARGETARIILRLGPDPDGTLGVVAAIAEGVADRYSLTRDRDGPRATLRVDAAPGAVQADAVQPTETLVAGLLGMTVLSVCLFGFASALVQLRAQNAFKLLQVWPITRAQYLASFVASRVLVGMVFAALFLAVARVLYGVDMNLSPARVAGIAGLIAAGTAAFMGMGVLAVARIRTSQTAHAICNLIYLPMIFTSDIFFQVEFGIPWLDRLGSMLPLETFVSAFSAAVFSPAGGMSAGAFATLAAWAVGTLVLGAALFRWHKE